MDRTAGYAVGKNKKPVNPQHSTVTECFISPCIPACL